MAVNNISNLINQICVQSGLKGKDLKALKARLEKMLQAELYAELTKALDGSNFAGDMGLVVEKTTKTSAPQPVQNETTPNSAQIQQLKEAQCKEISLQLIEENMREAFDIYNSQHLGAITEAYDNAKNADDASKSTNVFKVLNYQQTGFIQLIEAKNNNLTKREYYEENKQRIKDMILTRLNVLKTASGVSYIDLYRGKYTKEKITGIIDSYVESLCSNASMEDLKKIQQRYVSFNQIEEAEALSDFVKSAKYYNENRRDTTRLIRVEGKPETIKGLDKGIVPSCWDSDEPVTFEEVYKLERGSEYSQYKIEQYVQAKTEMETVIAAQNKKQEFVDFAKGLREESITPQEKEDKLLTGFAEFYALSEDGGLSQIQKLIDKSKMPITIVDGKLNLDAFTNETAKTNALNSLLKIAEQEKEKEFKAFLGDKSIEDYQSEFESKASDALGGENGKMLADAMKNDNCTAIQRYTGNASMAGMALTVVGGILCFTPAAPLGAGLITVGNTVAIGGMVTKTGLGVTDYATKNVQTQEELNDLTKDFIMDAGGFIIGMKAGQQGLKAFNKLIDKKLVAVFGEQIAQGNKLQALKTVFTNPEYLKNFSKAAGAKISADFLISYMGDLAMMGVLDTKDDWKSLLQANLIGILVASSGDIKAAARVNPKSNSRLNYEVSRNVNRAKRTMQYVEDKAVETYHGAKKVAKDVSKLIDFVSLDHQLKNLGVKEEFHRKSIIEFFKKTPIESNEIYNKLLKSIGEMRELQVRDNDIQTVLYHISDSNKQFSQSSLDIVSELTNLHKKAKENWDDRTASSLLFYGKNNAEKLEYLKEYNASIEAGYKFEDIKNMLACGIKGESERKAYEEILNSELTQRTKGGLGIEYTAKKYFKVCCDEDGKFNNEHWKTLQEMEKIGVNSPEEILEVLKNKDAEITKANIETFMKQFTTNPTEINKQYSADLITKCMTQEGKLDFSLLDYAQAISSLGRNIDVNLVKNKDGSYNQSAINTIKKLKDNGFENEDLHNILAAAKKLPETIAEGEIYSRDIIQKAIELKNAGIKTKNIGNMLNDCIENDKLDIELLENITPICKRLDTYIITETEWLIPMLKVCDNETQKITTAQIQKLMQNGFSTFDISMCKIFDFKNNIGSITPDNIIDAAIQLKQAGFSWNIKEILPKLRLDDGTLNTESLNLIIYLKNKGISESYLDNVLEIVTTEKGELLKDNIETVLSLLKEFKNSEFCNSKKDTKPNSQDEFVIYIDTPESKSDYISENGSNIALIDILIKMSSDEAGNINKEVLNANKAKLSSLYNKLEANDKDMFVSFLKRAANKQGSFDETVFNKINELKYLDDGWSDPNYNKIICDFLDACKNENGNLDIQKYNDAIMLVKKHKMSKYQATCTIDLYEELKPYQGKNFVHDLSITEKRQLQSLLLSHSNNLEGLAEVRKILKTNIIPTTDTGYSTLMKQLSQSLGDTNYTLSKPELDNLHNDMTKLSKTLQTHKPMEEVSVGITYQDLLNRIKSKMSGLSNSEKQKIYDYFGFTVKNGEIAGFPSHLGKNIEATDITDSFTKKVVKAVTSEIENFNKNNNIIVKDNPELSQILTSISKSVPEVYNKFSSPENASSTLKALKAITEDAKFAKLGDNEKQVLILGALLKDSNVGTIKETAFNIYNLANKFNMSGTDRQNLYMLLSMPDLIKEYNDTKVGEKGYFNNRFGSPTVEYDTKEVALDVLACAMKDHNLDNLSYLLYSTGENKLISPELQTEIKQRIYEIKSDDFILPQTHAQSIEDHATIQKINGQEVLVVNAKDIPNFYAYVHTPDAGAVNKASRTTKFSNFEEFQNIDSDAVICTSYISADKNATWLKNGFIFDIQTGNEYVGMGHDIFSLGKNKQQVVAEYYRNKGLKALSGKGYKYSHRTFISTHLKDILHVTKNSYSDLIANKQKLNSKLEKLAPNSSEALAIQTQIAKIDSEITRINDDYVARMDRVKAHISSNQINIEEIRSIDPVLADAYEQFLARDNTGHKFGKEALMRNDYWNEVLISNPSISAIYTKDINNIPEEYLIKAREENLPIVIVK